MSWTYTADPANSTRDAVRLLIGDTDTNDQQLQDGEISWFLSQAGGSALQGAIAACRALQAKYARLADTTVDDVQVRASQRRDGYRALIASLQAQAATSPSALPYCGGISIADKAAREADTDRVEPFFTRESGTVTSPTTWGDDA